MRAITDEPTEESANAVLLAVTRPVVSRLEHPEHCGDWHDKPLRWKVTGPGLEVQKFTTKADAWIYAGLRRAANSESEAIHRFIETYA